MEPRLPEGIGARAADDEQHARKQKEQGYRDEDVVPALVTTIWVLVSLCIFSAGLVGYLFGKVGL